MNNSKNSIYDELSVVNEQKIISELANIRSISYSDFKNKKITIYYHLFNKKEIIYLFCKNIFINNFKEFIEDYFKQLLNIKYPIIYYKKLDINIDNRDINLEFELICNGSIYKTPSIVKINNYILFDDNNIQLNIPIYMNNNSQNMNIFFDNFKSFEIKSFFNYEIDLYSLDITNIDKRYMKNYFSLNNNIPFELNYEKNNTNKFGLNISSIKYKIDNAIQTINLSYNGLKFFELNEVDISINPLNLYGVNILVFDESYIDKYFYIGKTIKNLGYVATIEKDLYKNEANVIFIINNIIDNNLLFFDEINSIPNSRKIVINFNEINIIKFDILDNKKNLYLPSNFINDDIILVSSEMLHGIKIINKNIVDFSNENGFIDVEITYSYYNYLQVQKYKKVIFQIDNLPYFYFNNKNDIYLYLINNLFDNEIFNYEKLNIILNNNDFDWLYKSKNIYVDLDESTFKFSNIKNNFEIILSLKNSNNSFLKNEKIIIDFNEKLIQTNNTNEKFPLKILLVILIILVIIAIITIILFIRIIKK